MPLFTLFFCNFHFNQLKFLHTNDTMNLNKERHYMNNKEISIFTVAEKAGVSIATVSRVLNNKGSVKQSTCNKVFEAAHELGYEIKENWKHLIILNLPNIANPFYHEIAKGVHASALRNGYKVLINICDGDNIAEDIATIAESENAAGVIILNNLNLDDLKIIKRKTNVVQCCDYCENSGVPYVSANEKKEMNSAMDYILSNGKRKIALINGSLKYKYAQNHLKNYSRYLKEHKLSYRGEWVVEMPEVNYDLAVSVISRMLKFENRPDAILAVSDVYAAAALHAAKNTGIEIKKDLVIVGFGNIDISRMCIPPITTINQPKYEIGCNACELLIEIIKNPFKTYQNIILDTELIIRET